jgi:hypothetical protein
VVNAIDHTYERADRNENRIGLYTGFKLFDERMRGVPKFEKFISMPGDGGLTNGTPIITSADPEIVERFRNTLGLGDGLL